MLSLICLLTFGIFTTYTYSRQTRLTLIQYLQDFKTYKLMCTHSNYSNSLPKGPFQVLIHFPLAVKVPSSVASLSSQQSKQCVLSRSHDNSLACSILSHSTGRIQLLLNSVRDYFTSLVNCLVLF